jgi:Tyrosine-protein kinase ephrin type A/B receptor-like
MIDNCYSIVCHVILQSILLLHTMGANAFIEKSATTLECATAPCMLVTITQRLTYMCTCLLTATVAWLLCTTTISHCHQGYHCAPTTWTEPTKLHNTDHYCLPSTSQFSVVNINRAPDKQGVTSVVKRVYRAGSSGLVYTATVCPPGSSCAEGATYPRLCAAGSYMDSSGAVNCQECPAGTLTII